MEALLFMTVFAVILYVLGGRHVFGRRQRPETLAEEAERYLLYHYVVEKGKR